MQNFDLIGSLRSLANTNNWVFLYGDNFVRNYEATRNSIAVNQLILSCDPFIVDPVYSIAGKISSITYTGLIMLGRKFEVSTMAKLDETFIQKYDRRLFELMTTLSATLAGFSCDNGLTLQRVRMELALNQLDENIDFIVASVTLLQE